MAKKVTKKVTKKRVRKTLNVVRHIFSHLLIIQLLHLQIQKAMLYHGQVLVVLASEAAVSQLLMLHRWQQRQLQKLHLFMV